MQWIVVEKEGFDPWLRTGLSHADHIIQGWLIGTHPRWNIILHTERMVHIESFNPYRAIIWIREDLLI